MYGRTNLQQNCTIPIRQLRSQVAIPGKVLNSQVKRVQALNEKLGPRQDLVIAAPFGGDLAHPLMADPV
jgi:hypothetical protein